MDDVQWSRLLHERRQTVEQGTVEEEAERKDRDEKKHMHVIEPRHGSFLDCISEGFYGAVCFFQGFFDVRRASPNLTGVS